jgi:hypothetical protein
MVQAAAVGVGTALVGALSKQSHPVRRTRDRRPTIDINNSPSVKIAKLVKKDNEQQRLYDLLSSPEILGLAMVIGGMYAANHIEFSPDKASNAGLQGTATMTAVLMGLGHAGVGDMTSLSVAVAAGGSSVLGGLGGGEILQYAFPWSGITNLFKQLF